MALAETSALLRKIYANPPNRYVFLVRADEDEQAHATRMQAGDPTLICGAYALLKDLDKYSKEGAEQNMDFFFDWLLVLMYWYYPSRAKNVLSMYARLRSFRDHQYERLLALCERYRDGGREVYRIMPGGIDAIVADALSNKYSASEKIRSAQTNPAYHQLMISQQVFDRTALEAEVFWSRALARPYASEEQREKANPEYRAIKQAIEYCRLHFGIALDFTHPRRGIIAALVRMMSEVGVLDVTHV
jgi:hypothetical protein